MNREIKTKWVAALRSGKYQQCTAQLKDSGSYCCLGVLAEELGALVPHPVTGTMGCAPLHGGPPSTSNLSPELACAVGLRQTETCLLIAMNDDDGKTFPEIADYIEEHL